MGNGILSDAEGIFKQMLSIGLFGILFLIIFGNLSGNLGFTDDSVTITNETDAWGHNATAYPVDQIESKNSSNVGANSFILTDVWGRTSATAGLYDFQFINLASNYSLDSTAGTLTNLTAFNNTRQSNLSVSYTFLKNSADDVQSQRVIGNLTSGSVTFFSFAPTIFTLIAVTVLILVILAVIRKTQGGLSGGRGGSPGFSG